MDIPHPHYITIAHHAYVWYVLMYIRMYIVYVLVVHHNDNTLAICMLVRMQPTLECDVQHSTYICMHGSAYVHIHVHCMYPPQGITTGVSYVNKGLNVGTEYAGKLINYVSVRMYVYTVVLFSTIHDC